MIHESSPWKSALAKDADLIVRWALKPPSERRSFLIERKLFLSAYSLRKLSDDQKLSTQTLADQIVVEVSPPLRAGFSGFRHSADHYFDFAHPIRRSLSWRRVLNLIIHSATFVEVVDEQGHFTAFMATSEREEGLGLVRVELAAFLGLIRAAAQDYPAVIRHLSADAEQRWVTWAGHDTPPER